MILPIQPAVCDAKQQSNGERIVGRTDAYQMISEDKCDRQATLCQDSEPELSRVRMEMKYVRVKFLDRVQSRSAKSPCGAKQPRIGEIVEYPISVLGAVGDTQAREGTRLEVTRSLEVVREGKEPDFEPIGIEAEKLGEDNLAYATHFEVVDHAEDADSGRHGVVAGEEATDYSTVGRRTTPISFSTPSTTIG